MRLYYQKDILTFMCCGNELFYSALYILHFTRGPIGVCLCSLNANEIRQLTNYFLRPIVLGISLLEIVAALSAPVAIVKTLISLLHAYVAAQNLAIIDMNEREANRQKELAKKPE